MLVTQVLEKHNDEQQVEAALCPSGIKVEVSFGIEELENM